MSLGNIFADQDQTPAAGGDSFWGDSPQPNEPLFPDTPDSDQDQDQDGTTEEDFVESAVEFGGRIFEITEPDIHAVIALVNIFGDIAIDAEKHLARQMGNAFVAVLNGKVQSAQPFEATIFGLMAKLSVQQFLRIAAVVLFGGKPDQKKAASDFFGTLTEDQVKIAPIVRALALRIRLSEDLADALGNFRLAQQAVDLWAAKRKRKKPTTPLPNGGTVVNSPST